MPQYIDDLRLRSRWYTSHQRVAYLEVLRLQEELVHFVRLKMERPVGSISYLVFDEQCLIRARRIYELIDTFSLDRD
jgi:hypothetical protein